MKLWVLCLVVPIIYLVCRIRISRCRINNYSHCLLISRFHYILIKISPKFIIFSLMRECQMANFNRYLSINLIIIKLKCINSHKEILFSKEFLLMNKITNRDIHLSRDFMLKISSKIIFKIIRIRSNRIMIFRLFMILSCHLSCKCLSNNKNNYEE